MLTDEYRRSKLVVLAPHASVVEAARAMDERKLQHIKVRADLRTEQEQAARGDRHDEEIDQHEIKRKQPASRAQARRMAMFHHRDLELTR